MKPIIRVQNLSKQYLIGAKAEPYGTFRESITRAARKPIEMMRRSNGSGQKNTFWALDDVSFDVMPGEVVGIIGRNGAGKSTLLKILSRITEPTKGRAELYGRVGSLLEVGTGFHPELTGRENIYLNGAILGMRREEISKKFDEIVDFAEIDEFLDTPVKRYSSGMYVRLAFAVAANLDPEILIVDEVLAVGDAEFQKKCLGKMSEVAKGGRTVIFVSHNINAISTLTRGCLYLSEGKLEFAGPTADAVHRYAERRKAVDEIYRAKEHSDRPSITRVQVFTSDPNNIHRHGKQFRIEIDVNMPFESTGVGVSFQIMNELSQPVVASWAYPSVKPLFRERGHHTVECVIPELRLYAGEYTLTVGLADERGPVIFEHLSEICGFDVNMFGIPSGHPNGWLPNVCVYIEDAKWETVHRDY